MAQACQNVLFMIPDCLQTIRTAFRRDKKEWNAKEYAEYETKYREYEQQHDKYASKYAKYKQKYAKYKQKYANFVQTYAASVNSAALISEELEFIRITLISSNFV
jgi:hypothetical protein